MNSRSSLRNSGCSRIVYVSGVNNSVFDPCVSMGDGSADGSSILGGTTSRSESSDPFAGLEDNDTGSI